MTVKLNTVGVPGTVLLESGYGTRARGLLDRAKASIVTSFNFPTPSH